MIELLAGQYLTTAEAAIRMHICIRMVQYLCERGLLGMKIGRDYMITPQEIENYLEHIQKIKKNTEAAEMKNDDVERNLYQEFNSEISPTSKGAREWEKGELLALRVKRDEVNRALEKAKKAILDAMIVAVQELLAVPTIDDACLGRAKKRLVGTQDGQVPILIAAMEELSDRIAAAEARLQPKN